jgi:polar amino acid transport system substrate-binding protein
MKRYALLILSSLLILSVLAGCGGAKTVPGASGGGGGGTPAASKTPTIDKIKQDGKLLVGTSPDYPPFETLDKANNVIGFDADIMQAVATKLGVKVEFVQMDFGGLIAALGARKFDVLAAGVSVSEERKKAVDFSTPYLIGKDAIVVHKDSGLKVTKLEDLKGKTVAVQIGTVQADAAHKVDGITVKEYNLFTEAAAAVSAHQADAVYLHTVVGHAFVKANPNLVIAGELPAADTAYALRKETPDLTVVVNQVLDDLQKSGEMDKLVQKWFK